MRFIKEGLYSAATLTSSVIMGGMGGTLYVLLKGLNCLNVNVPKINPNVDVGLNFDNVSFDGIFSLVDGFNEAKLREELANTDVDVDIDIPNIDPSIEFNPCLTPIYTGLGIGLGAAVLGLAIYHGVNCRRPKFTNDDVEVYGSSDDETNAFAMRPV